MGALQVTTLRKVSFFFKKIGWQSLLHGKINLELCVDCCVLLNSLQLVGPSEIFCSFEHGELFT